MQDDGDEGAHHRHPCTVRAAARRMLQSSMEFRGSHCGAPRIESLADAEAREVVGDGVVHVHALGVEVREALEPARVEVHGVRRGAQRPLAVEVQGHVVHRGGLLQGLLAGVPADGVDVALGSQAEEVEVQDAPEVHEARRRADVVRAELGGVAEAEVVPVEGGAEVPDGGVLLAVEGAWGVAEELHLEAAVAVLRAAPDEHAARV
eukprot:CAMPEP_0171235336 /NCGR_PEP_ID=MMETSP0790-20130122/41892_1 /TAXON_ID=2925 /ORGANISM="Alexandrium catenella, Strain OF101" /LENGTH=205 /DNA_ID=CAMNT_0011701641 /DNA_START=381 /DNA_END=996 /DNA_ORIENTATION=+